MTEGRSGEGKASCKLAGAGWAIYFCTVLVLALPGYCALPELYARLEHHQVHNDFVTFYTAGAIMNRSARQRINVYDHKAFTAEVLHYMPPPEAPIEFFMAYPPYFMPLMAVFAHLSLGKAWLVWSLLSLVSIAASLWLLTRQRFSRTQQAAALVLVLSSSAAWMNFYGGQTAALILLAITVVWLLLAADRGLSAGLVSGIVLFKLQFFPLLGLSGLMLGRWRFLAAALVAGLLLAIWGGSAVGWQNVLLFPASLAGNEVNEVTRKFLIEANFRTVLGMLPGITADNATPTASLIYMLVAVACFTLWWRLYPELKTRSARAFEICASLTTVMLVLFSIHGNIYDYLLLSPAFIWMWSWANEIRSLKLKLSILAFPLCSQPLIAIAVLNARGWSMAFFLALAVLLSLGYEVLQLCKAQTKQPESSIIL